MIVVLGVDPGALRLGWGLVARDTDDQLLYLTSDIDGLRREKRGSKLEPAQEYARRLIEYYTDEFGATLDLLTQVAADRGCPFKVVFEQFPLGGGENFRSGSSQSDLTRIAISVCHTLCVQRGVEWETIPATTIKLRLTGWGNATKAQVRDAVLRVFPELEPRKAELIGKGADEADGLAVAIVGSGFRVAKAKESNPRKRPKKAK